MSKVDKKNSGTVATALTLSWLLAAIFGDELFALIFFRDADSAFGFSIGHTWWWAYQFVVAAIATIAMLVLLRGRGAKSVDVVEIADADTKHVG